MDINFWINCNPKIAVDHTLKKYFGKYLYKIVLYAPGGRLIDDKADIASALEHRQEVIKNVSKTGWWGHRFNKDLDNANIELLEELKDIRRATSGLKLRIEEPRIQIYAETEAELIDLVSTRLGKFYHFVELVAGPSNAEAELALNSGAIIRKVNTGYTHKVILRDGRYTPEIKKSMLIYLTNLHGDVVHVSDSLTSMLTGRSGYIWNGYFYTNDPSVTTFLNLIHPNLVLNIHPLVVLAHK
jgi:hypothetical protein